MTSGRVSRLMLAQARRERPDPDTPPSAEQTARLAAAAVTRLECERMVEANTPAHPDIPDD